MSEDKKRTGTAMVPSTFGGSNPFHYIFHPLPYFLRKKVALQQILHQPKLAAVTKNKARTMFTNNQSSHQAIHSLP